MIWSFICFSERGLNHVFETQGPQTEQNAYTWLWNSANHSTKPHKCHISKIESTIHTGLLGGKTGTDWRRESCRRQIAELRIPWGGDDWNARIVSLGMCPFFTSCRLTLILGSLVAYFVVFFKNGFSPSDLRTAQQAGGDWIPAHRFHSSLTRLVFAVYFTKSSPDFVNHSGRILSSSQQVRALGEAQSIGDPFPAWCLR